MKRMMAPFFLFFLICFSVDMQCWSGSTHQLISQYAFQFSKFLNSSTTLSLGLDGENRYSVTVGGDTKSVLGWVKYGASMEDAGMITRSNRHFHNPLKLLSEAGLEIGPIRFLSSILWAQDGEEQVEFIEGDMSWQKARDYFHIGMISGTEESRQVNFGLMFKGLGHQMHLVQDLGCPEHTRNDPHPFGYNIEMWAAQWEKEIVEAFCLTPLYPDVDLITPLHDASTNRSLVPFSRLSDSDVYVASHPVPTNLMQQGLGEYSCSNFFSNDTIFSADFPFPKYSSTNFRTVVSLNDEFAEDERGAYLSKLSDGEIVPHLVRMRILRSRIENEAYFKKVFELDRLCFKDYASMLIPRAVGYSAALLNYFFRGEIEISIPETTLNADGSLPSSPLLDGAYSFTNDAARGFERMSLMARNVTANGEEMANGTVFLVVSYRLGAGSPFVLNPPVPGEKRHFKVFPCPGVTSIPRESPARIDVDMGADPLPVDAVDLTLSIVFKGDLGGEKGGAVAVGFRDISEPTPIDLFNGTDMACFNGNRVSYAEPGVVQAADLNGNGVIDYCDDEPNIIPRFLKPICLSFNGYRSNDEGETNYYYHFPGGDQALEIAPVSSHRLFVLGDNYPAVIRLSVHTHEKNVDPGDSLVPYGGSCLGSFHSNQVHEFNPYTNVLLWGGESAGYFPLHSDLSTYRGHPFFNLLLFDGVSIPVGSSCGAPSWPSRFRDPGGAREREAKRVGEPVIRRIR